MPAPVYLISKVNFKTHTGETPSLEDFRKACATVAKWYRKNGKAILRENAFGPQVSESQKMAYVQRYSFDTADKVARGEIDTFSTWQRVNEELTGECPALLP